jgi:hypothetical protein
MFSLNSNSDIDTYLQDLILQSISNIADEQSRLEIKKITETLINFTEQINNCSYDFHSFDQSSSFHFSRLNQSNIETIVSDLVHNFLFPTVHRILTQQKSHHYH